MLIWLTIGLFITMFALIKKSSIPQLLMSATVALVCYVGVLIFVTSTFVRSLRNAVNN